MCEARREGYKGKGDISLGTIKAEMLKEKSRCTNIVAKYVYDTNPVHFLSISCKHIVLVKKHRFVEGQNSDPVGFKRFTHRELLILEEKDI